MKYLACPSAAIRSTPSHFIEDGPWCSAKMPCGVCIEKIVVPCCGYKCKYKDFKCEACEHRFICFTQKEPTPEMFWHQPD